MPSEVSLSRSVQGREGRVEQLERKLAEAREQQAATTAILGVISRCRANPSDVFAQIAVSASRLCQAYDVTIHRLAEGRLEVAGHHGPIHSTSHPLVRGMLLARAVIERRTIHVPDIQTETEDYPEGSERALCIGFHTVLAVPLIHADAAIGVITLRRPVVQPFTDAQIAVLNTFADQAVIAIENTRLFEAAQASKRELQETLEYQTATSEVLGVISRSPNELQPVLEAIVETAQRLCQSDRAQIHLLREDQFHIEAQRGTEPEWLTWLQEHSIVPSPQSAFAVGRSAFKRCTIHVPDVFSDLVHADREVPRTGRARSLLAVPLLREDKVFGIILVACDTHKPFTESQIKLVETFADQAVIAIENTRLFEAEQASKRELQESLEYQRGISEVLAAISGSQFDLQPVIDTIVGTATRLCEAERGAFLRFEQGGFRLIPTTGSTHGPISRAMLGKIIPFDRGSIAGRVALEGTTVHVPDMQADPEITLLRGTEGDTRRTALGVPLLSGGRPLGAIVLQRTEVRPFTPQQIALVSTFADQAVIAIENTRLFEEVQARNRDLRVALEQQTVTSELLKVIGRSTFDLQPVFDTLAENAVRLCEAERALIFRFDGELLRVVATHNVPTELKAFIAEHPQRPGRGSTTARAALEKRTNHVHDVHTDPDYTYGARQIEPATRTMIAIPMLRLDELLGVITIFRHEVKPFSDSQIALLETFADQAAIAIENTRLFEEVQARNRDLTALGEVGRAVSSTLDLKVVLKTIVDRAVELSATDGGSIFYFREDIGRFELGETTGLDEEVVARFRNLDIATGQTGLGEAIASRKPLQVTDIMKRPSNALRDAAMEAGLRAALIVPLLSVEAPLGALVLQRRQPGDFPQAAVSVMQSFADQSAIALENARLFDEIAQKSRELEIASQHKSQFVANMSHGLRTPLAAILGYAELMQEGFYEPLGQKSLDTLTRIRSNGKHLLGLINTILDIAKIESGQFTLNVTEYAIESVVETVRSATESLAQNKKLALKTQVAKSQPIGLGDEQRITQVLLNLVGNAIKFTDAGEVRVTANAVNGHFNVSVTDTGPGIPEEHQTRIFEQL